MDEMTGEVGLFETSLHSLPLLARGKVRDNYAVGTDRILMVASDRLSAFDVVMSEPIPGKGKVLTEMALFWFDKLKDVVPNHLTGEDPESVVAEDEREQVRGRSMLVRRLRPLPVEAVVRGYLAGSAWKEYQISGSVCDVPLPPGLKMASKLPAPIFTPATKAAAGNHDENIDFDRMSNMVGAGVATRVRDISVRLYNEAAAYALTKGIIIADTKFEFGLDEAGVLTLMDEVLTPDSSRFWMAENYIEGISPPSLDKQVVRDWLEEKSNTKGLWNKAAPAPPLPSDIISRITFGYQEAMNRLKLARKNTKSRLAQSLALKASDAKDEGGRTSALAQLGMYYSRSGNVSEAEAIVRKFKVDRGASLLETVWRNLCLALFDHYADTGQSAIDRLKRAHALSSAAGERRLKAISAVWLAHFLRETEQFDSIRKYVEEALQCSSTQDHSVRSRANLVVGDLLLSADREDLAAPWHARARGHAAAEGDDATLGALAFNIALMRVSRFRRMIFQGHAISQMESRVATYEEVARSTERLLGTHAMSQIGWLQHAQMLSLRGEARRALPILEAFAHSTTAPAAKRMQAEWSSDIAWCYARIDDDFLARKWAIQAMLELSLDVHLDDLAALHSRLSLVYSALGDQTERDYHSNAAVVSWARYEESQHHLVNIFEDIQPNE